MTYALLGLYGLFALVALLNLTLMRRPGRRKEGDSFCVLIPARNEAENLKELIPLLKPQGVKIYVFDDESEDNTAEVAREAGAIVIRPREPLPQGWTGKNRACHELAKAAAEDSDARWYLFLDADTRPAPDFIDGMRDLAAQVGGRCGVLTGFPQIKPGKGIEPLFLAWVGWVILATNPFGVVSRTRMGHNRFTNGQVHAWKSEIYTRLWPNERVKDRVMEDVTMGRMLAKERIQVETANLTQILSVRMYQTWQETLDGMSKNSFEIANSVPGSLIVALLFVFFALGWLLTGALIPWTLGLFTLGGFAVALNVRTVWWPALFMPLVCLIGAFTVLRSTYWRVTGQTRWKGRTYQN
ncbi:MAG: hypothetical protein BGO01_02635 [Armatimonadetes bacterium 55-13]|nr:glycosyltransferase [Armatimonadota bacterium]ODU54031.1 MAG: hypothetical protein ABT09_00495 [bacterium SCN 57-13]OJU62150.1 MAG: hypothetical protein BGO01_02635 [Armatimonadetes bacterium 55-13]